MRINAGCLLNMLFLAFYVTTAAASDETVDTSKDAGSNAKDVSNGIKKLEKIRQIFNIGIRTHRLMVC